MDRNTVIGMVLVAIIIIATPYYMEKVAPIPVEQPAEQQNEVPRSPQPVSEQSAVTQQTVSPKKVITGSEIELVELEETLISVSNVFYEALISNKNGGTIVSFKLNNYNYFDSSLVNLIDKNNQNNLVISGSTIDGEAFELNENWTVSNNVKKLSAYDAPASLVFTTSFQGSIISKTLTFNPDTYQIDVEIDFAGSASSLSQGYYQLGWNGGLPITEKNEKDDLFYFKGYVFQGDDLHDPKLDKDKTEATEFRGQTGWVAVRNKYFLAAFLPSTPGVGASLGGHYEDKKPLYNISLYQQANGGSKTTLYLGPLEYKRIQAVGFNLDRVMTMGWSIIRPISRGVLMLLMALHRYIPNYGFILILFSVLVKVVVYPLTKKSYQSTRKMQEIQPQITALKEKHKSDPQKLNKATMALYKEFGVNPMGGCLPLLLQMPLLFALFEVFRSTIELRGAPFIFWIRDLSAPDTLMEIGGFPINILPLFMTVTMILQQSMMPTQAGQQKTMMYAMNIMFLFIFYRFPSGLNLYYTLFNILTILQQKYLTPHAAAPAPVVAQKTQKPPAVRKKK